MFYLIHIILNYHLASRKLSAKTVFYPLTRKKETPPRNPGFLEGKILCWFVSLFLYGSLSSASQNFPRHRGTFTNEWLRI